MHTDPARSHRLFYNYIQTPSEKHCTASVPTHVLYGNPLEKRSPPVRQLLFFYIKAGILQNPPMPPLQNYNRPPFCWLQVSAADLSPLDLICGLPRQLLLFSFYYSNPWKSVSPDPSQINMIRSHDLSVDLRILKLFFQGRGN